MNKSINILAVRSSYYKKAEAALLGLNQYVSMSEDEFSDKLGEIWENAVRLVRYRLNESQDVLAERVPGHYMLASFRRRCPEYAGKVRWDKSAQMFRPLRKRGGLTLDVKFINNLYFGE